MSLHLVATSIFHADGLSANEIRSGISGKQSPTGRIGGITFLLMVCSKC
jgi:hypothetical protein